MLKHASLANVALVVIYCSIHTGLSTDFCPCAKVMGWKKQQFRHSCLCAFQLSNMFTECWKLWMSNVEAKSATQNSYICGYYLDFYLYLFFFLILSGIVAPRAKISQKPVFICARNDNRSES